MRKTNNYNGIELRSKNHIKWLMFFDLCGWKWKHENDEIFLIIKERKILVHIYAFNWNTTNDNPHKNYYGVFPGENLLLCNGPQLKYEKQALGWYCNNSEFEPAYLGKFLPSGKSDKAIGLYNSNSYKRDILSGHMGRPERFSMRPVIDYINSNVHSNGLRVGDRIAEKIGLRTLIDKTCMT